MTRSPESPYWKRSGGEWIDDVAAASAALCEKLAGTAYEIERTAASAEPPTKARDTSQLLTIKKAAELLKCHEDTIRAMGKRGEIEICNTGPRRQRIKASEIMRLRNTPKFVHR